MAWGLSEKYSLFGTADNYSTGTTGYRSCLPYLWPRGKQMAAAKCEGLTNRYGNIVASTVLI